MAAHGHQHQLVGLQVVFLQLRFGEVGFAILGRALPVAGAIGQVETTGAAQRKLLVKLHEQHRSPTGNLPGNFTGFVFFYTQHYRYRTGTGYVNGRPIAGQMRLMPDAPKDQKAGGTAARPSGCITYRIISHDPPYNETICQDEPDFGPSDFEQPIFFDPGYGGDYPTDPGSGSGGGGGGSDPPPPTPPACATLTNDGQNPTIEAKMNELKGPVNDNKEYGVGMYRDAAGNIQFSPVAGQPNAQGIDISSINGTLSSFTHTHYTGLLSIFLGTDLRTIWKMYLNNNMENPSTFNMNLITASVTVYSLSITDINSFKTFGENTLNDPKIYNTLESMYSSIYGIKNSNTVSHNENSFFTNANTNKFRFNLFKGNPNDFSS